jgi:uncharacterized protein YhaN
VKIRELAIENFGILADKSFQLDSGLQVIYGANEAGKSTLLHLIRSVLFGFPHRCEFTLPDRAGEMAATAFAELDAGDQIRFRRRKGRTATVTGEFVGSLDPLDEESLAELIGANDLQYKNLFAISLTELAAGEESLKDVGLSQALYGSGTGSIASFQNALNQIREDHSRLFKPRGRTLPMNQVLDRIREHSDQLRAASVRPSDYVDLLAEVDRLEKEVTEIKNKLDVSQKSNATRKRLLRCEKAYAEFKQLTKTHSASAEALADDKFIEVGRLTAELESSDSTRTQIQTDIDDRVRKLNEVRVDEPVAEEADAIRGLYQRLSEIESCRADVVKRLQKSETTKKNVLDSLREIHPDWTLESLTDLPCGLEQRREVGELLKLWIEGRSQSTAMNSRQAELQRQLSELNELPQSKEASRANWQALSQKLPDVVAKLEVLKTQHEEVEERKRQIVVLQNIATEKVDLPLDVDGTGVPSIATIQDFADENSEGQTAISKATALIEKLENRQTQLQTELETWSKSHDLPSAAEVDSARRKRDTVWEWICQRYLSTAEQDPTISSEANELPKAIQSPEPKQWFDENQDWAKSYQDLVAHCDDLTDRQLTDAAAIQQRQQLEIRIGDVCQDADNSRKSLQSLQADNTVNEERWRELWSATTLMPPPPQEMLVWSELRQRYLVEMQRVGECESKCVDAFEVISRFVQESDHETPAADLAELGGQLQQLRDELNFAQKLESQRNATRDKFVAIRTELDSIAVSRSSVEGELKSLDVRWQSLRQSLGLPKNWDLPTAESALERIVMARQRFQQAIELDHRVAAMGESIETFEREIERLTSKIGLLPHADLAKGKPYAKDISPENIVRELFNRLEETTKALRERKQLDEDLLRLRSRKQQKDSREEAIQLRLKSLATESGYKDVGKFRDFVTEQSGQRTQIQRIAVLQKEMMTHLTAERWEDAEKTLASAEFDSIRQLLETETSSQLESGYQQVLKDVGAAREKLADLDATPVTAKIASDLESLRAELSGHVDQWAPLVLADRLMKRAIERFRKQRQPQLLEEVASLLKRLTGGRYLRVHSQLDDKETLLVTDADGCTKSPDQLSTGTREQLYLAIRLAYIRHYSRTAESLPLVLDDILVNFDNDRARATLEVLAELSRDHQILFMTCHRNVVDMIQEVLPSVAPVHLRTSSDEKEISAGTVPTPKPSRRRKRKDATDPDQQVLF